MNEELIKEKARVCKLERDLKKVKKEESTDSEEETRKRRK